MAFVIRDENINKLMALKFRINSDYKNDEYKFHKIYKANGELGYINLIHFANEPQEIITNRSNLSFMATKCGYLILWKVNCGGYHNGDYYLWLLMKLGIVEYTEYINGETKFRKCF